MSAGVRYVTRLLSAEGLPLLSTARTVQPWLMLGHNRVRVKVVCDAGTVKCVQVDFSRTE